MGFYETYIHSPEWQEKRRVMLDWAGGRCQQCGYSEDLEVHHRTYDRLGSERLPEDLEVLCSPCHALLHGRAPRALPIASSGPSRLEKQQAYSLSVALRDALGRAIARGDDATAVEIRKVMTEAGKRKVQWSRKRRRKEMHWRRSDQRHEPAATWEAPAYTEWWIWDHRDRGGLLARMTWPG